MGYSNSAIYKILYDAMIYAGHDPELAHHAAMGGLLSSGKIADRRIQDRCQDRYIATVIECARVATLAEVAVSHSY